MKTDLFKKMGKSAPIELQENSRLMDFPTLWLHGAGMSGSTWDDFTRGLPMACTPDLPWHGSEGSVQPATVENFASSMSKHLRPQTILIGHSLGGMVAMELAVRFPGKVAALILIESVPKASFGVFDGIMAQFARFLIRTTTPKFFARIAGLGESSQTKAELQRQLLKHTTTSLSATIDAAAAYNGLGILQHISVPTLIIVSIKNKSTHRGAQLTNRRVSGSKMIELTGGHHLYLDNPIQLMRAIDSFLCEAISGDESNTGPLSS